VRICSLALESRGAPPHAKTAAKNNPASPASMACNLHLFAHLMKQQQLTFRSTAGQFQAQFEQF
jgi:hypothetical protein